MTTTRRRFTTNDVIIGVDCGIEWGTPIGQVRFYRDISGVYGIFVDEKISTLGTSARNIMHKINALILEYCSK